MIEKILRLRDERERLCERLKLLNVPSTGKDRVIERIEAIDEEVQSLIDPL